MGCKIAMLAAMLAMAPGAAQAAESPCPRSCAFQGSPMAEIGAPFFEQQMGPRFELDAGLQSGSRRASPEGAGDRFHHLDHGRHQQPDQERARC